MVRKGGFNFSSDAKSLLNFPSSNRKFKFLVCKILEKVFTSAKTSASKSSVKIIWLSSKRSLIPLLSGSRFSKKSVSNATICDSNWDTIRLHVSPCVNHRVVHAFRIFRGFCSIDFCASSKTACFTELYLKCFQTEKVVCPKIIKCHIFLSSEPDKARDNDCYNLSIYCMALGDVYDVATLYVHHS